MKSEVRNRIVKALKRFCGIPLRDGLSFGNIVKYQRLRYGPYFYKKKYDAKDVVMEMRRLGLAEGRNVFIHSSWNEFYNYTDTEEKLIEEVMKVIGPEGTLMMPAYPLPRKKIFDVRRSVTKAGMLAEEFRKYPGVKRSVNVRHSVCALGPLSDYILGEHHLGDNCWDEKSPYYKLAEVNALVFVLGLSKRYLGTMVHCVEGVLFRDYPYFQDMFTPERIKHNYIDYDGVEKSYASYESCAKIVYGLIKPRWYFNRYIKYRHHRLSNLDITVYEASQVIPTMIENARKGIVLYSYPKTTGYRFDT